MRQNSGFTLIEMVIVIVVIGILLGIAVPRYGDFKDAANRATAKANVSALKSAASMYYAKQAIDYGTGSYPPDTYALEALLEEPITWPSGYYYYYDPSTGTVTLSGYYPYY